MSLQCGIVGLPNVGKSTLFNCLSNAKAQSANFPFCTIEPNVGVITVPDERLIKLGELCKPERGVIPTTVEIVDIAGLVKGASKGEGLGNKFLANIRETDAIIHVLRCFDDENVVHVDGDVIGPNIRLDEYRLRAYIGNRQGCGNIGIGRYNDLIPRADPQRFQSKHQRVQAVAHAYTVLCIAVLGEGLFKRRVFLSLNIPAGPKNTFKGRPQVRLQFPFHGKKAGKRNLHPIIPLLRRQYRRSFSHTPGIHHNPGYNPPHHTAPMPGPSAPRPGKNRTSPAT